MPIDMPRLPIPIVGTGLAADVRFYEGLRTQAHNARWRWLGGPASASRQGRNPRERGRCGCRGLYGDLIVADWGRERRTSGPVRWSRVLAGLNAAL